MALPSRGKTQLYASVAWLVFLWVHFLALFRVEWTLDAQYSYGFIVPLCAAYLFYLRWPDRPAAEAKPSRGLNLCLIAGAASFIPLAIIRGSNPEWRAALWAEGLLVVGLTLLTCLQVTGRRWTRHFAPAIVLMLMAVPWPRGFESQLVNDLMRGVAAVVVELMNLLGHYAEQRGNLVLLRQGTIGVEEACSGVRSLQSTLMAAVFVGLLFRWRWPRLLGLVALGVVVSLGLNVLRTLTLTWITVQNGPQQMERWHDPLGAAVAVASVVLLFVLAALYQRWRPSAPPPRYASSGQDRSQALPAVVSVLLLAALLIAPVATAVWYAQPDEQHWQRVQATVTQTEPLQAQAIPERVEALLRYSEGAHYVWEAADGTRYTLFFFHWGKGRTSSHAGVHRPDVCLPSAGYELVAQEAPLTWNAGAQSLEFETFRFQFGPRPLYVFFSVWDAFPGHQVPIATNWQERLANVWHHQRVQGRYSVELIVEPAQPASLRTARQQARRFLERHLQVAPVVPSAEQP
ncbi:MAG: hypothetical protein E1N59_1788 [Puniceicoccaceae bacterium 5H]|nr:MAG: hypothetical protein E1N59_1788 [Puniceicoccaceae bacterium 5H]